MYGTGANESHRGVDDRDAALRHGTEECAVCGDGEHSAWRKQRVEWARETFLRSPDESARERANDILSYEALLTALTADLDAARKDSERLDWLTEQSSVVMAAEDGTGACVLRYLPVDKDDKRLAWVESHGEGWLTSGGDYPRDAIDAARSVPHAAPEDRP